MPAASPTHIQEISEADASTTYAINRMVYDGRTSTGTHVQIADSPTYGRMLFLDGELQSASADEHIYHETLVHPAMANAGRTAGGRVLVVGGGEGATVREVLKWPAVTVDWIDYDSELVALSSIYLQWAPFVFHHPRVTYYAADARDIAAAPTGRYDVVILDLPDPDGETGWLYSADFWARMKGLVAERGRLVTHCGPVRPFGDVGAGFLRVREALGRQPYGFYPMSMPSFQGEWGFWMWAAEGRPFGNIRHPVPEGVRVATNAQILAWESPQAVWREALAGVA